MHTVKRVCTLVLTGLLALPMAAPAGAEAASFSDLPSSHWAYIAMTEAAGYGILQGTGANTMSPSAPLTWPQFLAMAARAFAPEEYARSAASGAAWDQAGLDAARSAGLLEGLDEAALALPARKLSGGQKRRTALLRALWAPGNTLLLDEPFTGMDPAALQASIALLRERVEGRPVLLATHDRAAIDALGWPVLELQKLAQPGAACNSTNKGLQ